MGETKQLRIKDIAVLLDCGETTAQKHYSDIKKEFGIKTVLRLHFDRYFQL